MIEVDQPRASGSEGEQAAHDRMRLLVTVELDSAGPDQRHGIEQHDFFPVFPLGREQIDPRVEGEVGSLRAVHPPVSSRDVIGGEDVDFPRAQGGHPPPVPADVEGSRPDVVIAG